jgi:predicted Ser/Thr protein kinase
VIQKIGKYRILERVGRGGMGLVYKAHDPVLDRVVALKVISGEVDVTDELRTRFFREAQACARLSHPNIITVYDLGEEDGHLFIVMEFLEGEELKQLIGQRRSIFLEDKLSLMIQVCDGLEYAHQKGIVHRDIKPGNIFVLRNGRVKILDFGIARIATEAGLTRTGLIMGTLRYMSPEQARGRVDHRSDIFSVGSVFYELLAYRPPFGGEDAMEILEQLRSENPPALTDVEPTVPRDLAAIIDHALQKDPAQRFAELGQMRAQLEQVRRRLADEAEQGRARVRAQLAELRQLQEAMAERVGGGDDDETLPIVDERARLAAVEGLLRTLAQKIERVRALVARADELAPTLARGLALLERGLADEAVTELERVVEAMPEHARARAHLERARSQAEERRRHERNAELLRQAGGALERGAHGECLELLAQLSEPAPAATREAAALRQAAESGRRRARANAERAREVMDHERRLGEGLEAARHAPGPWSAAEAKLVEAQVAAGRESFAEATDRFEEALELYRQAARAARDAREAIERTRAEAHHARAQSVHARRIAEEADAERDATAEWTAAAAKEAEAEVALRRDDHAAATALFAEVARAYGVAAQTALREAVRRERARADEIRGRADDRRRLAEGADAARHAHALWEAAEARSSEGQAAFAQERYSSAGQRFNEAIELYGRAEATARKVREALLRAQQDAEEAGRRAHHARVRAAEAGAEQHAAAEWAAAESRAGQAATALEAEDYATARARFTEALHGYEQAATAARAAVEAEARRHAEQALERAEQARRGALETDAARHAMPAWSAAEAKLTEGRDAFARKAYPAAAERFAEARELHGRAESAARAAREARERARTSAEAAREDASRAHLAARDAGAEQHALAPWTAAVARETQGRASLERGDYAAALDLLGEARRGFEAAADAARREARRRARAQTEQSRERSEEARRRAEEAQAARHAAPVWTAAEAASAEAGAAFGREAYADATPKFEEAQQLYGRAEQAAREAVQLAERARADAQQARDQAARARRAAVESGAEQLAAAAWTAATTIDAQAGTALEAGDDAAARARFTEAEHTYEQAAAAARAAVEAEARRRALAEASLRAEQALERAEQARRGALETDAARHAMPAWGAAEAKLTEGRDACARQAYPAAAERFAEALELYGRAESAARAAREALERARTAAEAAHEDVSRAHRAAVDAGAEQVALAPWTAAVAKETQAAAAIERADHAAALDLLREARRAFEAAADAARRRARAQAEQSRERSQEARRRAEEAQAARHAASLWTAAEAATVEGGAAFGREAYADATPKFEEARQLYGRAEQAAREAAQLAERARADAQQARDRAARARRSAAESGAEQHAAAQWTAAVAQETRASASLARDDYEDARAQFAEAGSGYEQAAATARAGAEEAARRLDAVLHEARRLLEAGRFTDCLVRVKEITARTPRHAAAFELRAKAEAAVREAEATRAAVDRTFADGQRRLAAGNLPGAIQAFQSVLARDAAHPGAARALEEARARQTAAREVTRPQPAPPVDDDRTRVEDRTDIMPTVLMTSPGLDGRTVSPVDSTIDADATVLTPPGRVADERRAPRGPTAARRLLSRSSLAVAAVVILAISSGTAYWYYRQRPATTVEKPEPPPRPKPPLDSAGRDAAEAVRKQVVAAREAAAIADAERLAPKLFDAAAEHERAAETAYADRNFTVAKQRYGEAVQAYDQASALARQMAEVTRKEGEVRQVQSQMSGARRAAELAGAPKLAATTWTDATQAQSKAENALKQRDFDEASGLFARATQGYRDAEAAAVKAASAAEAQRLAALKQQLQAAEQAAAAMATARRDAEQAGAARYAQAPLDQAKKREQEATADLNRKDYTAAAGGFREAQQRYQQAQQAAEVEGARVAALQRAKTEAEDTRERVVTARQAAEQSGADRYPGAGKLIAAARTKERDGQTALGRQDYGQATQGFRGAATDYQAAAQEARREADAERQAALAKENLAKEAERQAALAKESLAKEVEQARSRLIANREQALKTEADSLAKDLFEAAHAKEAEGERLASAQNLTAARQTYQDAADRYEQAARRARPLREARTQADQARTRMLAEKQRARSDASDFGAAVAQEKQGDAMYQRLAFKEAADSFRSAADLFAKAAALTRPEPKPPVDPKAAIRTVLETYTRALETKDLDLYLRIRPGLRADEIRRMRDTFDQSKSIKVDLKVESIELNGNEAQAKGRREDVLVSKTGQTFRNQTGFTFRLRRTDDGWTIESTN